METVIAREMPRRHCEECGDEAIQSLITTLPSFARKEGYRRRASTMRLLFTPLLLLATPQQLLVLVKRC
jgi:hypothetical protein